MKLLLTILIISFSIVNVETLDLDTAKLWTSKVSAVVDYMGGQITGSTAFKTILKEETVQTILRYNGATIAAGLGTQLETAFNSRAQILKNLVTLVQKYQEEEYSPEEKSWTSSLDLTGPTNVTAIKIYEDKKEDWSILFHKFLQPEFASALKNDTAIKSIYFSSPHGLFMNYPPKYNWTTPFDSSIQPFYVNALTGEKDVLIYADFPSAKGDSTKLALLRDSIKTIVQGLTSEDFIFLDTGINRYPDCSGTVALNNSLPKIFRATEQMKTNINSFVSFLESQLRDDSSGLEFSTTDAIYSTINTVLKDHSSRTVLRARCKATIITISTDNSKEYINKIANSININNPALKDHHLSFYITNLPEEDPSEDLYYYRPLKIIACSTTGVLVITTVDLMIDQIRKWYLSRAYAHEYLGNVGVYFSSGSSPASPSALYFTLSIGITGNDGKVIGVIGLDLALNPLQTILNSLSVAGSAGSGRTFAALIDLYGDVYHHPQMNLFKTPPYNIPISLLEQNPEFTAKVLDPLQSKASGSADLIINRRIVKGDVSFEGVQVERIPTVYYWRRVLGYNLIALVIFAEVDLRGIAYDVKTPVPNTIYYQATPSFGLNPTIMGENVTWVPTPKCGGNLTYSSMGWHAAPRVWDMSTEEYLAKSALPYKPENLPWVLGVQNYMNDWRTYDPNIPINVTSVNPGLSPAMRGLIRVGHKVLPYWNAALAAFPGLLCPTQYAGDPNGIQWFKPMRINSAKSNTFDVTARPWFTRAIAEKGRYAFSVPYYDASLLGKVLTISKAVIDNVFGTEQTVFVAATDIVYSFVATLLFNETGCAKNKAEANLGKPLCLAIDNSGLFVAHPAFLTDNFTNTQDFTSSDQVFLGLEIAELAEHLISIGFITSAVNIDYLKRTSSPVYSVNSTILENSGGILSGSLRSQENYCIQGNWTLTAIEGSNAYLIMIEGYSELNPDPRFNNGRCRTIKAPPSTPLIFPPCYSSEANKSIFTPVCKRESDFIVNDDQIKVISVSNCSFIIPVYPEWDSAAVIVFLTFTCCGIFWCFAGMILVFYKRKDPIVKAAVPSFLIMILVGAAIGYSALFWFAGEPDKASCNLRYWFGGISFYVIFAPLMLKSYRVIKIFFNPDMKKIAFTTPKMMVVTGLFILFECVYCALWTGINPLEPGLFENSALDDDEMELKCTGDNHSIWLGIFFATKFFILGIMAGIAIKLRKVHDPIFREASQIGFVIYNQMFISAIALPIIYFVSLDPSAQFIIIAISLQFSLTAGILIMFLPKIFWMKYGIESRRGATGTTGAVTSTNEDSSTSANQKFSFNASASHETD